MEQRVAHVTARQFGALGDSTTDDTAALTAAVNSLPASGGRIELTPDATYRLTADLPARPFLMIEGNGAHIRQDNADADGLAGVDVTGLVLRNLTIRRGTPLNGTGKGVRLTRSANAATVGLLFENVTVRDFGSDGIELSNPIVSSFRNVTARNCGGHGWNVHGVPGGAAGTSCRFDACYGDANMQAGFRLENMVYTSLGACAADLNGINYEIVACQGVELAASGCETPANRSVNYPGHNVVVRGGFGVVLDALWTYESLTTSLWVTDAAKGVVVRSMAENTPKAEATHCIRVDAGCRVTIEDCNNVRPYSLAGGTTTILNDGGGLSIPGYMYGASTAYFEGEIGTSAATPSYDGAVTPRGWVNARLAEHIPLGTATAKGDLLAASAAGAVSALPVGGDGEILAADSSEALGVRWVPPVVGEVRAQRTTTGADTLTDTDSTLLVNAASNVTVGFPPAAGRTGRRYTVVKLGTGVVTLDPAGSETIAGLTSETITTQFGFREVESDGTNWVVVGGKVDPVITTLPDTGAGGTVAINAAAATIYRGRLTGATATLTTPTNPADGDVLHIELYATVACTLTIGGAIIETGGLSSSVSIPAGKMWSGALRYRAATSPATSAAAWRLLGSSVDN